MIRRIDNNEIAGAAAVVLQNGQIIYSQTVGYANMDKKEEVKANTIYRLASMTKPILAVAALLLVEQGKLKLTDPIHAYLPEYAAMKAVVSDRSAGENASDYAVEPAERYICIIDLLNHTSGLGMGQVSQEASAKVMSAEDTLEERISKWSTIVLDFQPGTATGYSGLLAFDILGRIIEVVSGLDLQQFLITHLFEPLQMPDTRFILSEEQKKRTAVLYEANEGSLNDVTRTDLLASIVDANRNGYFSGAAGLFGTAQDYLRFVQMLVNEGEYEGVRILKRESIIEMRSNQLPEKLYAGQVWGLGVRVIVDKENADTSLTNGSYGWSGAYGTHFWVDPEKGLAALLMMNLSNIGGASSPVAKEFEQAVYASCEI
ncbi:beta-lactamase family protein [Paenibacillus mendelii]|nr:beta-lactamase family protein [Paenibacillus mendelii]